MDLGFRLKLDVKPVAVPTPTASANRLQLLYNFHADLPEGEEAVVGLRHHLRRWSEAAEEKLRYFEERVAPYQRECQSRDRATE